MCHTFTPLVTHHDRRKVVRCSCGTLHLVWHRLNLSLSPAELGELARLLAGGPDLGERRTVGAWHLHVGVEVTGLWYGPFGATFTRAELDGLRSLVDDVSALASPRGPTWALN